ncbi:recombinase family protein [Staphylococcus nepalensis]|uniref:recombinase family protein n=1 Tax=Staphylococcus nepalensis TaxID=214473 RepID=UPI003F493191
MNVIALAHNITDEREDYLDEPIDTLRTYCKKHGYKIAKVYDEESTLVDDIKDNHIKTESIVFWGLHHDYPELKNFAQNEISNLLQYFQCWYNTFTTVKVNWEDEHGRINHITR